MRTKGINTTRFWLAVALAVWNMTVQAQDPTPSELYFNKKELPNGLVFLPAPPDSSSAQYLYDISQYVWGESRVIAGYHWQSDTDASRLLASACYVRLHTSEEFLEDMAAARKEFAEKKAATIKR